MTARPRAWWTAHFLVLATLFERGGLLRAFAAAIALAIAVQGGALWALKRAQMRRMPS